MKIETKYNIGDIVYFQTHSKIEKAKVINIRVELTYIGIFEPIYTMTTEFDSYKLWGKSDNIDLAEGKISDSPVSLIQKQIEGYNRQINDLKEIIASLEEDIKNFNK